MIVGAGKMGRAHAQALNRIPGVQIVGIASRGGASAEKLCRELNAGIPENDWQRLLDSCEPDACVVAVDHEWNETVTRAMLERGLHVLTEKPAAFSSRAAEELAAIAAEKRVVAMAAMNRRFYSSVAEGLERVLYYGRLLGITAILPDPVKPFRQQGTMHPLAYRHWLVANSLHLLDLLRHAGGEIAELHGIGFPENDRSEARFVTALKFSSGAIGTITFCPDTGGPWQLFFHGVDVEAYLGPLHEGWFRVGNGEKSSLANARNCRHQCRPGIFQQALAFVESVELGRTAYPASDLADHAKSIAFAENLERLISSVPSEATAT